MLLRFCALRALHTTSIRDLAHTSVTPTLPRERGATIACAIKLHVKDLGLMLYQPIGSPAEAAGCTGKILCSTMLAWYARVVWQQQPIMQRRKTMERQTPSISHVVLVGVVLACVLVGVRETAALEIGESAPDFTLPSTTGETISLRQFQGKQLVLLEFYGDDFAPV